MNRSSLHVGLCAVWAAITVSLTACGGGGGGAAAPTNAPAPAASTGAAPAPSPARPALASPAASPSPIVAAPTSTATAEPAAGTQSYEVQSGDTLGTIAQQFYGDSTQWRPIYDANKDAIGANPDALKLGTKLTIPPKPTPPPS